MPAKRVGTDQAEGVTFEKGVIFQTQYGENAYTSIRRFVIIKQKEGHCLCLYVNTNTIRDHAVSNVPGQF
jgi:hypothetical protein